MVRWRSILVESHVHSARLSAFVIRFFLASIMFVVQRALLSLLLKAVSYTSSLFCYMTSFFCYLSLFLIPYGLKLNEWLSFQSDWVFIGLIPLPLVILTLLFLARIRCHRKSKEQADSAASR
jgi:hypothetical protein